MFGLLMKSMLNNKFAVGYCTYPLLSHLPASVNSENAISENDVFKSDFVNRNPQNLEQMLLSYKPLGFALDYPSRNYWHTLLLEKSNRHVTGKIVHNTGRTVVSASTQEWAIQKQLYSTSDHSAVENVARILAKRCLECGILYVHHEFLPKQQEASKVQTFLKVLEEEGVVLKEPDAFEPKTTRNL